VKRRRGVRWGPSYRQGGRARARRGIGRGAGPAAARRRAGFFRGAGGDVSRAGRVAAVVLHIDQCGETALAGRWGGRACAIGRGAAIWIGGGCRDCKSSIDASSRPRPDTCLAFRSKPGYNGVEREPIGSISTRCAARGEGGGARGEGARRARRGGGGGGGGGGGRPGGGPPPPPSRAPPPPHTHTHPFFFAARSHADGTKPLLA
jgi:hypothetical protein